MKKANYYIKARLFPTIICIIPFLSLYFIGFDEELIKFLEFLEGYKWAGDVTVSAALIYMLVQANRFIAKEVFQRIYFKDEKNMPTTNYLLPNDSTLSDEIKRKIYNQIQLDFNIQILGENVENNEVELRKTIMTAVSQIRNSTRENALLLQHNIEYGFMRNLLGGALLSILLSCFNMWFFNSISPNEFGFKLNFILAILYLIPVVFSKLIINRYGHYYAKILFEQYLSK